MLISLPFIVIFSLFGERKGKDLVYVTCKVWSSFWYCLIFIRHKKIYLAPHHYAQQYIFVANHKTYLDIPQVMMAMRQSVRILGRHDLAKIPVFGIVYRAAVILVDRSNNRNKSKCLFMMKKALERGSSIFIFPEGSFNETDKTLKTFYDGAFSLSMKTGIPIKPIIFPDTIKRLHYKSVFSFTPGISRSVYLEEIKPDEFLPNDIKSYRQKVFEQMWNALTQYQK